MSVRFGECLFDPEAHSLFRGPVEVHLSPKAFQLLKLLIENRPRALSKTELLERVWPGVFVSEASLAKVVNQIRSGVADSARQGRVVRTVHAYGYAFVAAVSDPPRVKTGETGGGPTRSLGCGRREFLLTEGEHIVGREPAASVRLISPKVSRRHSKLVVTRTDVTIEDLASKNGTSVRGTKISVPTPISPGDKIQIGPFTLVYRVVSEARSTETETISGKASPRRKRDKAP